VEAHRAHVAAVLRAEVRAWLESEGAVSVARESAEHGVYVLEANAPDPTVQEYAAVATRDALAALAEQVGQVASVGEGEG
jgi:hypothetical protein